jgi:preprotein translocase subunit YajC
MFENIILKPANAQEAQASPTSSITIGSFAPLILIFGVFYFLIIRPQNKKIKDHQEMVNNLKIGTKVITNSGIIGIVKDIDDKENQIDVEISQGVVVKMLRAAVNDLAEKNLEKKISKKTEKSQKKIDKK